MMSNAPVQPPAHDKPEQGDGAQRGSAATAG